MDVVNNDIVQIKAHSNTDFLSLKRKIFLYRVYYLLFLALKFFPLVCLVYYFVINPGSTSAMILFILSGLLYICFLNRRSEVLRKIDVYKMVRIAYLIENGECFLPGDKDYPLYLKMGETLFEK